MVPAEARSSGQTIIPLDDVVSEQFKDLSYASDRVNAATTRGDRVKVQPIVAVKIESPSEDRCGSIAPNAARVLQQRMSVAPRKRDVLDLPMDA